MKNPKENQPQVKGADVGRRDFLTKTALAGAALALSSASMAASRLPAAPSGTGNPAPKLRTRA